MQFKEKFLQRYEKLTNIEEFKTYCFKPLRKSIRVNTLKTSIKEIKERLKDKYQLEQVPWCKEGFWFKKLIQEPIGKTLEHQLGYIYVQESASMIPPLLLDLKNSDLVLDMAASPGSKTSQISAIMENNGLIVANDNNPLRITILKENLQRLSCLNVIITMQHGRFINQKFDKILLDAPCSGTGVIRKSIETLKTWNPNTIKKIASVQKQLIQVAFNALNENGILVYSTCSLEPDENEAVIDYLLENNNAKIEKIDLDIKSCPPILEFENQVYDESIKNCLRIWPQDNDTEGFFIAKIRKL